MLHVGCPNPATCHTCRFGHYFSVNGSKIENSLAWKFISLHFVKKFWKDLHFGYGLSHKALSKKWQMLRCGSEDTFYGKHSQ